MTDRQGQSGQRVVDSPKQGYMKLKCTRLFSRRGFKGVSAGLRDDAFARLGHSGLAALINI